ncbi:hypothetical protein [Candidatus Phytoplasma oryzae]|nr:hypothetical protein PIE28_01450 [Candidatus Phytoplasma oryzae]
MKNKLKTKKKYFQFILNIFHYFLSFFIIFIFLFFKNNIFAMSEQSKSLIFLKKNENSGIKRKKNEEKCEQENKDIYKKTMSVGLYKNLPPHILHQKIEEEYEEALIFQQKSLQKILQQNKIKEESSSNSKKNKK